MVQFRRTSSQTRWPLLSPLLVALAVAACSDAPEVGRDGVATLLTVEDVGFSSPRAVIHDPVADVYLVSNLAGDPFARDENGFVSRILPDGEVLELHWVPPFDPRGAMSAPSGMAIRGDSLFVADIDCIAIVGRESGTIEGRRCLDGVSALRGLSVGPEGSLFATDGGLEASGQSSGSAAVYRLLLEEGRMGSTIAQGAELGNPNSIAVGARGIFVVTGGPGQILRFTPEGAQTTIMTVPNQTFEGVAFTADGGFAYTSSADSSVYLVDDSGAIHTLLEGIGHPGDLGYDATRHRLLVPVTDRNQVLLIDLD